MISVFFWNTWYISNDINFFETPCILFVKKNISFWCSQLRPNSAVMFLRYDNPFNNTLSAHASLTLCDFIFLIVRPAWQPLKSAIVASSLVHTHAHTHTHTHTHTLKAQVQRRAAIVAVASTKRSGGNCSGLRTPAWRWYIISFKHLVGYLLSFFFVFVNCCLLLGPVGAFNWR